MLSAISLFTGAGGLDYGFEAAGFTTAASVEFDAACCATLRRNRPAWKVIGSDLNLVGSDVLMSAASLAPEEPDVLIGGPPCQPFSKSGYWATGDSARLGDPRASTLVAYLRVLRDVRPKAFLLENVEGLGFKGKDEGLRLVLSEIEEINRAFGTRYVPSVQVLNAADFGVPQIRRRLFIVGARDGTVFEFPKPTHFDPQSRPDAEARDYYRTSWDALHNAPKPSGDHSVSGKWAGLLPTIPEGENYLWHTARGGGAPLFGWRRRFWNFLLKNSKDRPSWTLQAQPGPATGPFHWDNRRLSREEMMRLQTFPSDIVIDGSLTIAQRQVGNAVPSLLAEVLGREIAWQLLGRNRQTGRPRLSIDPAPVPAPRSAFSRSIPAKFLGLIGEHAPHPGTGLGNLAIARSAAVPG